MIGRGDGKAGKAGNVYSLISGELNFETELQNNNMSGQWGGEIFPVFPAFPVSCTSSTIAASFIVASPSSRTSGSTAKTRSASFASCCPVCGEPFELTTSRLGVGTDRRCCASRAGKAGAVGRCWLNGNAKATVADIGITRKEIHDSRNRGDRARGSPWRSIGPGTLPIFRDRGRAGRRHRITDFRIAVSCCLHGEQRHQRRGSGAHGVDSYAAPARRSL
jgi:hypothetical protein